MGGWIVGWQDDYMNRQMEEGGERERRKGVKEKRSKDGRITFSQ